MHSHEAEELKFNLVSGRSNIFIRFSPPSSPVRSEYDASFALLDSNSAYLNDESRVTAFNVPLNKR